MRLSTLFWLLVVSATAAAMFLVKYEVQNLEDALARTAKAATREQHEIRILTAEWAYLNRPEGLAQMNQRYLRLIPIPTKELGTAIADIPLRPPPEPAEDGPVAAAAPPAAAAVLPAVAAASAPPPQAIPAPPNLAPARPIPRPGPARSLDELFARIAASR